MDTVKGRLATARDNVKREIKDAESVLREAGISIARFCADNGIHPSTWRAWRDGALPQTKKWIEVTHAIDVVRGRAA